MEEQQSSMVEWVNPLVLKPHPKNVEIYGDDGYKDLVESIKELGVMQAVYIKPDKTIISGHRRWLAAKEAGTNVIPTITVKYDSDLSERQAIIEFNRYRIKNGQQLFNEGHELEAIEGERAKARQATSTGGSNPQLTDNFREAAINRHKREASYKVAETIGLGSGKQWDKLKAVATSKPELLLKIKPGGRSLNSAYKEVKRVDKKDFIKSIDQALLVGKYNVFYADPPWKYDNESTSLRGMAEEHYPTMTLEDIKQLPVTEHALDEAVLFLWTTTAMIRNAFEVIDSWGFSFKTSMVWVKDYIGTGFFVRSKHEYLLIATKGSFLPMTTCLPESVVCASKAEHSKKPLVFYDIIEQMYPEQKYIELFARSERPNWDRWGNEIE